MADAVTHLFPDASDIHSGTLPSGPLKVGNDWTGYFIRGDEALALAQRARIATTFIENDPLVVFDFLYALADKLESCRE